MVVVLDLSVDRVKLLSEALELLGENVRVYLRGHLLRRMPQEGLNDLWALPSVLTTAGNGCGRVAKVVKPQRGIKTSLDQRRLEELLVGVAVAQ